METNTYDNRRLKELWRDLGRFQELTGERERIAARLKELAELQPELYRKMEKERAEYEEAMINAQKWYAGVKARERVGVEQLEMVEAEEQYRSCGAEYEDLLTENARMEQELVKLKSIERTYRNQLIRSIEQNRWKDTELGRSIRELEEQREVLRKRYESVKEVLRLGDTESSLLNYILREIERLLQVLLPQVYTSGTAAIETRDTYKRLNEFARVDYSHRKIVLEEMEKLPQEDRKSIPIDEIRAANEILFDTFVVTRYRKRIGTDIHDIHDRKEKLHRAEVAAAYILNTMTVVTGELENRAQAIEAMKARLDSVEERLLLE